MEQRWNNKEHGRHSDPPEVVGNIVHCSSIIRTERIRIKMRIRITTLSLRGNKNIFVDKIYFMRKNISVQSHNNCSNKLYIEQ